jgi:lathosterol oxidase
MALISQRGFSLLKMLFGFGFLITTTFAHFTDLPFQIPGLKIPKNPHVRVLEIDNFYDFLWATLYVGLFYFAIFLGFGGVLEYTNPIPKNEFRWQTTKKQLLMGLQALLFVILSTTLWLWFGDKHMPYFGF